MRISWVVLSTLVMAAAATNSQNEDKTLSAAVLTITRALQDETKVPAVLHSQYLIFTLLF